MLKLALGLTVAIATAFTTPAVSLAKTASSTSRPVAVSGEKAERTEKVDSVAAPMDREAQQKLKEHLRLRNHIVKNVKYPATKESLVSSFRATRDIKAEDKKWLEETLSSRIYDSSDEVIKALGWEVTPTTTAAAK